MGRLGSVDCERESNECHINFVFVVVSRDLLSQTYRQRAKGPSYRFLYSSQKGGVPRFEIPRAHREAGFFYAIMQLNRWRSATEPVSHLTCYKLSQSICLYRSAVCKSIQKAKIFHRRLWRGDRCFVSPGFRI